MGREFYIPFPAEEVWRIVVELRQWVLPEAIEAPAVNDF